MAWWSIWLIVSRVVELAVGFTVLNHITHLGTRVM